MDIFPLYGLTLLLSTLLLGSSPAHGFVRTRSTACNPLRWEKHDVIVAIDRDFAKDLSLGTPVADGAVNRAIASWSTATETSCFRLRAEKLSTLAEVGVDDRTLLKARVGRWCRPASGDQKEQCYSAAAAAITTVFFVNQPAKPELDGKILDADIEFNAVNMRFYDADGQVPAEDGKRLTDLWNTLTHELGHVQGLAHTCQANSFEEPECVVDHRGKRPPLCGELARSANQGDKTAQEMLQTSMVAVASDKETIKRIPKSDDIAGLLAATASSCSGCACGVLAPRGTQGAGQSAILWLWVGGALVFSWGTWVRLRRANHLNGH